MLNMLSLYICEKRNTGSKPLAYINYTNASLYLVNTLKEIESRKRRYNLYKLMVTS
jgi:hypothetical protein